MVLILLQGRGKGINEKEYVRGRLEWSLTEALSTEMQEEEAKTSVMKTRGIGKDETQDGLREAWEVHE